MEEQENEVKMMSEFERELEDEDHSDIWVDDAGADDETIAHAEVNESREDRMRPRTQEPQGLSLIHI